VGGGFQGTLLAGDLNVTATSDVDGFVLEVSADGTPVWFSSFGGSSVNGLAFDPLGQVLVVGGYDGSPDFGRAPLPFVEPQSAFLTKLDADGKPLSTLTFGVQGRSSSCMGVAAAGKDAIIMGVFDGVLHIGDATLRSTSSNALFAARLSP